MPLDASPDNLILKFPQSEFQALAKQRLFKINTFLVLLAIAISLVMGEGNIDNTIFLLKGHLGNFLFGVCITWLMQIISYYWIGNGDFWYSLHADRIVYHRPPESEEILFDEIRELQYVPLAPGDYTQSAISGPENYFCIAISLNNNREIRIAGYLNMLAAWDFLSSRLPGKISDHRLMPKEFALSPGKILKYGSAMALWCFALYYSLPEKPALILAMLSLASFPLPYLCRFHHFGRPPSEKHVALIAYFWLTWFLLAAIYLLFPN